MHALNVYIDIRSEGSEQCRRALGHALWYMRRQVGRNRASGDAQQRPRHQQLQRREPA